VDGGFDGGSSTGLGSSVADADVLTIPKVDAAPDVSTFGLMGDDQKLVQEIVVAGIQAGNNSKKAGQTKKLAINPSVDILNNPLQGPVDARTSSGIADVNTSSSSSVLESKAASTLLLKSRNVVKIGMIDY
jgi:hypothetical protein